MFGSAQWRRAKHLHIFLHARTHVMCARTYSGFDRLNRDDENSWVSFYYTPMILDVAGGLAPVAASVATAVVLVVAACLHLCCKLPNDKLKDLLFVGTSSIGTH